MRVRVLNFKLLDTYSFIREFLSVLCIKRLVLLPYKIKVTNFLIIFDFRPFTWIEIIRIYSTKSYLCFNKKLCKQFGQNYITVKGKRDDKLIKSLSDN